MSYGVSDHPVDRMYRSQRIFNDGNMAVREISRDCDFTGAEKTILATSTVAGTVIGGCAGGPVGAVTGFFAGAGVGIGIVAIKRHCENN